MARYIAAFLFLLFASLQHNDPDPVGWVIAYALPAVLTLLPVVRVKAAVWGVFTMVYLAAGIVVGVASEPQQHANEALFEGGGLLLVAIWSWWQWRRQTLAAIVADLGDEV